MPRNPNAKKNLKPCKKGETHNPNGRPRNKLKDLKVEHELSADDLSKVIMILMDKSVKELEEIKADKSQPMLMASFASALIYSYKTGNLNAISVLVDRLFGKATQKTEASVTVNSPNFKVVFDDKDIDGSGTDNTPTEEVSTVT